MNEGANVIGRVKVSYSKSALIPCALITLCPRGLYFEILWYSLLIILIIIIIIYFLLGANQNLNLIKCALQIKLPVIITIKYT